MIKTDAQLRIQRISLSHLQVTELTAWTCHPERFMLYLQLLQDFPDEDVDPLIVTPSKTHPSIFPPASYNRSAIAVLAILDKDAICIVEEPA